MIPSYEIDTDTEFDPRRLGTPGRHWVQDPGPQIGYDVGVFDRSSWEVAKVVIEEEQRRLAILDARAADAHAFDALAYELFDNDRSQKSPWAMVGELEFGVSGLVVALSAAGCVTASSCRGHVHESDAVPYVLFRSDPDRAALVAHACATIGCGFWDVADMLVIHGYSVAALLKLAELVVGRRAEFERIPMTVDRLPILVTD